MKSNPKTTPEYEAFSAALRRVVRVPHDAIRAQLDAEKDAKEQRRIEREKLMARRATARKRREARASDGKD